LPELSSRESTFDETFSQKETVAVGEEDTSNDEKVVVIPASVPAHQDAEDEMPSGADGPESTEDDGGTDEGDSKPYVIKGRPKRKDESDSALRERLDRLDKWLRSEEQHKLALSCEVADGDDTQILK